jgi:hypothetical protein
MFTHIYFVFSDIQPLSLFCGCYISIGTSDVHDIHDMYMFCNLPAKQGDKIWWNILCIHRLCSPKGVESPWQEQQQDTIASCNETCSWEIPHFPEVNKLAFSRTIIYRWGFCSHVWLPQVQSTTSNVPVLLVVYLPLWNISEFVSWGYYSQKKWTPSSCIRL